MILVVIITAGIDDYNNTSFFLAAISSINNMCLEIRLCFRERACVFMFVAIRVTVSFHFLSLCYAATVVSSARHDQGLLIEVTCVGVCFGQSICLTNMQAFL